MRRCFAILACVAATTGLLHADADRWWSHVKVLADDALEGRNTGSIGHKRGAEYVAGQFEKSGLEWM